MKLIFKILLSVILIFILVSVSGIFYLARGLNEGKNIRINGIDVSNLNDGIYNGKYKAGRWKNELNITVKDHKIIKIDIKDDVTFPNTDVSNELFSKVIGKQNTTVDVISEATVTSKAYLKSIEDALNNN
ncbi:FMN-binding protein [Tissierella sp. MB52-C2]|uniref:FMN-binding protein n=1 Tax=Tissierella sp. MB52-C2 TaxID=3070999 RepID=UPI00280BFBF5|nr:FMN-binding protein [Tissierella sp. MB52-C2]WMM24903.1 FMN-binding protein [Tissierella sp. MB52-C2]